jgi:dihydrodipicolinate reductase
LIVVLQASLDDVVSNQVADIFDVVVDFTVTTKDGDEYQDSMSYKKALTISATDFNPSGSSSTGAAGR